MHVIAYCYHWGRTSLWDMTRSERKAWYALIRAQKEAENKATSKDAYKETESDSQESDSSEED